MTKKRVVVHWGRTNMSPPWCSQTGGDVLVTNNFDFVTCKKCKKRIRRPW